MLSWIPLLGPIIEGCVSVYTKWKDTQLGMRVQEVEEAKISAQIISSTNEDILLRIIRDAVCLPVAVWSILIGWDTIMAHKYPSLMWHVASYPSSVAYLPYAVLVFLLGNIGINMWTRR